jgi:catecholate siderophore receptor
MSHAVVTGLELTRESSENFVRAESGPVPPNTDLFSPNPNDPYQGVISRTGASTDGVAKSVAVYAFDTVDLDRSWQVTGGLRWEQFETDYTSFDGLGGETPYGRTDSMLSWRAGVVYKPRANGSVYFGAGNSFNPSAEGLSLATGSSSLAEVEPEKSQSYEVGTKWDVADRRLSLTSALFHTEKTNARTPGLNPGDPPTVLEGRHRVRGLELGFAGNITPEWSVFGGYTFMDSQIEESNNASEVGNAFGNTPRHSFNAWTSWELPWNLEVGGGAFYVGDRYNNNSETRLAPGYWQVDAMAALRLTDELTLRVNAVNLANERFIDRVGGGHFIPGVGRSVTVTTTLGF